MLQRSLRVLPTLTKMSSAAHVHSVAVSGFGEGTNDLVSTKNLHMSTHTHTLV